MEILIYSYKRIQFDAVIDFIIYFQLLAHRCVQHKITAFLDENLCYKVTSIFMKVDRKAVQRNG